MIFVKLRFLDQDDVYFLVDYTLSEFNDLIPNSIAVPLNEADLIMFLFGFVW